MDLESERQKRRRKEGSTVDGGGDMIPIDRISNLPESIISHILSLLPTKSAVVTSFLSKNWKFRWTKIAAFDFDDQLWPSDESQPEMNFVKFVNLVFANLNDSIHKLRFRWQSGDVQPAYLNIWLNAAITRNVRHLDLAALPPSLEMSPEHNDENYEFMIPVAVFSCAALEVLKLRGPFLVKLPHGVSLPKLTVLKLIGVKYECDVSVEKLVSSCPVLHSLVIKRLHYHGNFLVCNVSSRSLKSLKVYFEDGCDSCVSSHDMKLVIDTPVLEHLVLDCGLDRNVKISCFQRSMQVNELEIYAYCLDGHGIAGLIKACDGVKVMKLWEPAAHVLLRTTPLPATFGRLTKLVVDITRTHWSSLLDLMDRCIVLQVLDITPFEIGTADVAERILEYLGGSYWSHPIRVPGCLSSSLKHVYFRLFEGLEDEMAMLKFILDHGLLIETVTLSSNHSFWSPCSSIDDSEKFNILNQVSMLRRASTACTISYS